MTHIDWMRGLACVLMFQTHCYDSWLNSSARSGSLYRWSQLGGTLPAPLFLFLAGIAVALVIDRKQRRGVPHGRIALETIRRGGEILGLGLLFRLQEWAFGQPWAPWTDLLRVDILNEIGVSIMLLGVVYWIARTRWKTVLLAAGGTATIAMLTPLLWTSWRPGWLPWYLESYINGVYLNKPPQSWLFPIFPWAAFAFAGLAFGVILVTARARSHPGRMHLAFGAAGAGMFGLGLWFSSLPIQVYPVDRFWHTSPNFFLARLGVLLMVMALAYAWCRWVPGFGPQFSFGSRNGSFSPLVQLGTTSLIVYWVHIEFVYGRFSILPKHGSTIPEASVGLVLIFVAMLLLSIARTQFKGRGAELRERLRKFAFQPFTASQ